MSKKISKNSIAIIALIVFTLYAIVSTIFISNDINNRKKEFATLQEQIEEQGVLNKEIKELTAQLSELISKISIMANELEELETKQPTQHDIQAEYCRDVLFAKMNEIRTYVDKIETITNKQNWPMPSYTDLLHRV